MDNSDSDTEDHEAIQSQSSRLRAALHKARKSLSSGNYQRQMRSELGSRFPFASGSSGSSPALPSHRATKRRKKLLPWKVLPCCVEGPGCVRVPTRGSLDKLCKVGLGVLWFTRDDMLSIATYLTAEELHFLLLCLYPPLKNIPYEFCKAAGPGNNVIISLPIEDRRLKPSVGRPFVPFCTPDRLKSFIGRKGKLYVRPLVAIDISTIPPLSEHVVCLARTKSRSLI